MSVARKSGLTLIELLLVLLISSCLLLFSTASYQLIYRNNQVKTRLEAIQSILHFARIEARARGRSLVLRPLYKRDWSTGMQLLLANLKHTSDPKLEVIQQWAWNLKDIHLSWHGFQAKQYLLFSPEIEQSALNGYFLLESPGQSHKLLVNRLGRIRLDS